MTVAIRMIPRSAPRGNTVPSPLAGEGQGEGAPDAAARRATLTSRERIGSEALGRMITVIPSPLAGEGQGLLRICSVYILSPLPSRERVRVRGRPMLAEG